MESQVAIYGVTEDTAAAYADGQATRDAIRVAGMADATWPASDKRMTELVSEILIEHVLSFAIHARRHLKLRPSEGLQVADVSARLPKRYEVESFTGNLWRALQIIIHSKSIMSVPIHTGESLFTKAGDQRICYLKVIEEQGKEHYFCPFGLVHTYLARNGSTNLST